MEAHHPLFTTSGSPTHAVRDLYNRQLSYSSYNSATTSSYGLAEDEAALEENAEVLLLETLGRELMAILTPLSLTMLTVAALVHVLPPDLNQGGGDMAMARLLTPYYQEQVRTAPPNHLNLTLQPTHGALHLVRESDGTASVLLGWQSVVATPRRRWVRKPHES